MHSNRTSSINVNSATLSSEPTNEVNPALEFLKTLIPIRNFKESCQTHSLMEAESQRYAVRAIAGTLYRTIQRHAVVVGDRGVGKSSTVEKFAAALAENKFSTFAEHSILQMDVTNVGPGESRGCLETIVDLFRTTIDQTILVLDGFASLIQSTQGRSNISLISSLLARKNLSIIAIVDAREYNEFVASNSRLHHSFQRIDVDEPSVAETEKIVQHRLREFAESRDLAFGFEIASKAITLSSTFILSERQPAKSIYVLQRAIEDLCFFNTVSSTRRSELLEQDIVRVVSERTGIPISTIKGTGSRHDYHKAIGEAIVGQPDAIQQTSEELQLIAAGLADNSKPASVMMFAGTTGVGKTELAKRIAELYSSSGKLKIYPMGNFTESHSVSGLIGVPPGYVGHEEGGLIVTDLLADPYSVFLLDEAEKCHPNVWKPFLNLFDEGWIIDQQGRKAFADRAIFILTTNAGDRSISQMTKTGKTRDEISQHVRKTLSRVRQERSSQPVFPPQFLSRMRRIIVFSPLDEASMISIAEQAIARTIARWQRIKGKKLVVAESLIKRIGVRGRELNELVNGEEGGRIVAKLICEHIEHSIVRHAMTVPTEFDQCNVVRVSHSELESLEVRVELATETHRHE